MSRQGRLAQGLGDPTPADGLPPAPGTPAGGLRQTLGLAWTHREHRLTGRIDA